ncbi:MAG: ABC transporter permease [Bacillota bacterium]|jgi:hypothetical protein
MIDFIVALWGGVKNLFYSLHPRQLRRFAAELPVLTPLAVRSVRRRLPRYLMVGVSLGAGIIIFLVLSASFRGSAVDLAGRTSPMDLPADIVVLDIADWGRAAADLGWVGAAGSYEVFDSWEAPTSVGLRRVLGLPEGGRLLGWLGLDRLPPPGGVLLAADVAAAAGLRPGDTVLVGRVGQDGFTGRGYRLAGLHEARDSLFRGTLVMSLEELLELRATLGAASGSPAGGPGADSPQPTALAAWAGSEGTLPRMLERVKGLFPDATIWWAALPGDQAYRAVGGFLAPGRLVLALVFVLAGLGVFNVMLLSLLGRKAQLGVLKALGSDDDEVFLLLFLEGGFMALGGSALGLTGGALLVRAFDRVSELPLLLTPSALVWAAVLGVVSFYLASWFPATLCRRASPIQLMAERRLYLDPRSTCAQCGRCGGF